MKQGRYVALKGNEIDLLCYDFCQYAYHKKMFGAECKPGFLKTGWFCLIVIGTVENIVSPRQNCYTLRHSNFSVKSFTIKKFEMIMAASYL